jgi:arylsulfatase A-like enzyme
MEGVPLLGEVLRRAGYATYGVGKWHNGAASFLRSFDRGNAVMLGGMSDHFAVPVNRRRGGKMERYDARGKHSSELIADAAIDFLKGHASGEAKGKPYFLYVAFTAPHDPRDPPKKFADMYDKKDLPLPKNFLPQHPFNLASDMTGRDEVLAPWPRPKEMIRDQLAEYYGLITHMDEQIGRILQALRDTGELENTIIIFAADNGLALGSHGLLGKQSVYEHSVGVPLIFAGPGIPRDQRRDDLVYLFDLFPTLCAMNRVAVPEGVNGKSLADVIAGKRSGLRDSAYFNYKNLQRAVRDDRWKLIAYPKINHVQLFDMKADPDEMHNLAGRSEQANRVAAMKKLLLEWEQKLGAKAMPLTVAKPLPREIDLTGHKRTSDQWQPQWIRKKYFAEKAP